jgi:hypothetical protein
VPAKQCLGRDDGTKLVQRFAPEHPRLLSKLPPIGISEDDAPPAKARAEHAVLGFQIVDRRGLLPLQPTGEYHQQELQKSCRGSHRAECWLLLLPTSTNREIAWGYVRSTEFWNNTPCTTVHNSVRQKSGKDLSAFCPRT